MAQPRALGANLNPKRVKGASGIEKEVFSNLRASSNSKNPVEPELSFK